MSNFLNKHVINVLRLCLNCIKLKAFKKDNYNFIKHKFIFLAIPIILLVFLTSLFTFNICNGKYDINSLFENYKTIINLPVTKEVDSSTLNKMQQITTNLLNYNSNVQSIKRYDSFVSEILKNNVNNEIKITTNKSLNLTQQQKELLFNEFRMQFPNLIKLDNASKITAYTWKDTQKNFEFWIQLAAALSILIILLLIYFGIKFKKLGSCSTTIIALLNLVFSIGSSVLILVILTNKINLTFMVAMLFYFTINLTILFNEIRKQLPSVKITKTQANEFANKAIQKTMPITAFIVTVLFVALTCSTIFSIIFNNYILFYFTLSTVISVLLDLLFNLFCNAQLWVILKRKNSKKISKPA